MLTILRAGCIAAALAFGACTALAQAERRQLNPMSFQHARAVIQRARVLGITDLRVLVATQVGQAPSVLAAIEQLGGRLEAHFDEVGYLRVRLHRDRVLALTRMAGVVALHVEPGASYAVYRADLEVGGVDPQGQAALTALRTRWTGAGGRTRDTMQLPLLDANSFSRKSPFVPWRAIGADSLLAAHPTFDGRGVTIALFEFDGPDFMHPTLQRALTLAGDTVSKFAGIIDPKWGETPFAKSYRPIRTERPVPIRPEVRQEALVEAAPDGSFEWQSRRYYAPGSGRYSFGWYQLASGPPSQSTAARSEPPAYPVLWRVSERAVWIDTSAAGDFRQSVPVYEFNDRPSLGVLPNRRQGGKPISFAVSIDSTGDAVSIIKGTNGHVTMAAGNAAGHNYLGGELGGVAPAARLLVVTGFRGVLSTTLEAFMRIGRRSDVDVISASIGASHTFPDADGFAPLMMDRIGRVYDKPIFLAMGNGGQLLGGGIDLSSAKGAITIGAYSTRADLRLNYAWQMPTTREDWLQPYSSWGPVGNGVIKPDLLAPAGIVAPTACGPRGLPDPLPYRLPDCYELGDGTSQAAPVAAGAAASLVSAAKQAGISFGGARIRSALETGARYLGEWPVAAQGSGLLQLPAAWKSLQHAATLPEIEVSAPVRHGEARFFRVPNSGEGLFERNGWSAGERRTRLIHLTRRTGAPQAGSYGLEWIGNDGTFATESAITLPLGREVTVPVTVQPRTTGAHDAILTLVDRSTGAVVRRIGTTVVAADQLTRENGFAVHKSGVVPFGIDHTHFVKVPSGTAALRVTMRVTAGRIRFRAKSPSERDSRGSLAIRTAYLGVYDGWWYNEEDGVRTMLIDHPDPGAWELSLTQYAQTDDSTSAHPDAHYELSVTLLAAQVEVKRGGGAKSTALAVTTHNTHGNLIRASTAVEIGVARTIHGLVRPPYDTISLLPVQVDSGAQTLWVRSESRDGAGELFLYLYNCTTGSCVAWDAPRTERHVNEFVVRNPSPGEWRVGLDPVLVPPGGVAYEVTAVVTNPRYGVGCVNDTPSARALDEAWTHALSLQVSTKDSIEGRRVAIVETRDDGAEKAERASTLGVFLVPPQTRPVAIGRTLVELEASPRARGTLRRNTRRQPRSVSRL